MNGRLIRVLLLCLAWLSSCARQARSQEPDFARWRKHVALITAKFDPSVSETSSVGAAFAPAKEALLLTSLHVVAGASEILVYADAHSYSQPMLATLVAADEARDLALLKLNGNAPLPIEPLACIGTASEVDNGTRVLSVGHSPGSRDPWAPLHGRIHALKGNLAVTQSRKGERSLQNTAPIEVDELYVLDMTPIQGHSGSPAIAPDGRVVGMVARADFEVAKNKGRGTLLFGDKTLCIPAWFLTAFVRDSKDPRFKPRKGVIAAPALVLRGEQFDPVRVADQFNVRTAEAPNQALDAEPWVNYRTMNIGPLLQDALWLNLRAAPILLTDSLLRQLPSRNFLQNAQFGYSLAVPTGSRVDELLQIQNLRRIGNTLFFDYPLLVTTVHLASGAQVRITARLVPDGHLTENALQRQVVWHRRNIMKLFLLKNDEKLADDVDVRHRVTFGQLDDGKRAGSFSQFNKEAGRIFRYRHYREADKDPTAGQSWIALYVLQGQRFIAVDYTAKTSDILEKTHDCQTQALIPLSLSVDR